MVMLRKSPLEVDKKVVDELLLVCGVIGSTVDPVTQTIVPVEDCLQWLQDLQRALRRDEDAYRPISLLLGKWKVVEQKLLPLVISCRYDTALVITLLKILVILTKPISETAKKAIRMVIDVKSDKLPAEVVQEQIRLRENAIAQSSLLAEYKQLFVHHSSHRNVSTRSNHNDRGLFSIFVSLMTEPLSKTGVARSSEDHLTIELVLHLFRNLLSAGDSSLTGFHGDKSTLDNTALHLEMIQLLDRELVLDILLVIGQEIENRENKQYNLLLMEILHHLLKIQDPALVARSSLAKDNSVLKQEKAPNIHIPVSDLKSKLISQRQKMENACASRHSHFGGTLALKKPSGQIQYLPASTDTLLSARSGISPATAINACEKRRKSKKDLVFVGSGRNMAIYTKPGVSISSVTQDIGPSNQRANKVLHQFCDKFLINCYGPVMKSLKNEFRRESNRLEDGDLRMFFRIIWFFCQWWRVSQKNISPEGIGPLIVTMDIFMFKRVIKATEHYYDHKKFSDLAQAVSLYTEMMFLLSAMFHATDSTEQIMALGLMDQLFYHSESMDSLPKLLSRWIPGIFSREYMCDLLELSHVTLKLLESNAKLCSSCVEVKTAQKRRSKKSHESLEEPKDAVSHMKAIAASFDVKSYFIRKLVSSQVVFMFSQLLSQYNVNAPHINRHITAFFLRFEKVEISSSDILDNLGKDDSTIVPNLEPLLFNLPLLTVLNEILSNRGLRNNVDEEFLLSFAASIVRHYANFAKKNHMVFVETLFRHSLPIKFCETILNFYITDELKMLAERDALLEKRKTERDEIMHMRRPQIIMTATHDDDDDGEMEFDQRFEGKFELRKEILRKSAAKVRLMKSKRVAEDSKEDSEISDKMQDVEKQSDGGEDQRSDNISSIIETNDPLPKSPSQKRYIRDEDEVHLMDSVYETEERKKARKRLRRAISDSLSEDDEDDSLGENGNHVVIKPNWDDE